MQNGGRSQGTALRKIVVKRKKKLCSSRYKLKKKKKNITEAV